MNLQKLYTQLSIIYKKLYNYTKYTVKYNNLEGVTSNSLRYVFKNSKFSKNILNTIDDYLKRSDTHIVIQLENCTLNIILSKVQIKYFNYLKLHKLICRIQSLLSLYKVNKHFTFWIIPVEINKYFPIHNKIISEENVNGGFTFIRNDNIISNGQKNTNNIYIFRYEEYPKVILHEIIHHLPMETTYYWSDENKNELRKLFNISKDTNSFKFEPSEAITEAWTIIFHCLFLSIELYIPYKILLQKELEWGLIQTKRILNYQKAYFPLWKENTNIFSYIILRTILLYNVELFLKIKPHTIKEYIHLIINVYNNKNYQKKYKYAIVPKHNSLRMSVFGNI